jgi:hypothetical protein
MAIQSTMMVAASSWRHLQARYGITHWKNFALTREQRRM